MLLFLTMNFFVFLALINVCFQRLISNLPPILLSIALCLLVCDFFIKVFKANKLVSMNNLLDFGAIIGLTVSFVLFEVWPTVVYLQIGVLFKLKDIFLVNHLLFNLVKEHKIVFKTYIIFRIAYWIILVSHILGCLFYALDIYLI